MHFEAVKIDLPLRKTFAIAKGAASTKTNVLCILDGHYYGEGGGSVAYGPSAAEIESDLHVGFAQMKKETTLGLETLLIIHGLSINAASRAALMGSVVNCLSGQTGKTPWELLGLKVPGNVRTSVTFALDDPETTFEQIMKCPYSIIKVKMGDQRDAALLKMLSRITGKEIRVDANGGWSVAQAEEMVARLAAIGVRVIEQPTAIENITEWSTLKPRDKQVEFFIDEGMNTLADFERLHEYCDGANIKMAKSGGVLDAIRMARAARMAGKKVMLGCMVESSIGIAQSMYMSSLADYFDLDGPLLLEKNIAEGLSYEQDMLKVNCSLIGGPKLNQDVVQTLFAN